MRTADPSPSDQPIHLRDRLTALIGQCAQGHQQAFAELYDLTADRIYGLILRIVRDPSQAAEVTQEAYLQVWQQAGRHDPALGSVLAWMSTLAHRRAVDRVRSVVADQDRSADWAAAHQQPGYADAFDKVAGGIDADRVRQALGSLSEIQREALSLAYFRGHTQAEIAELLDLPLGTVKTRIRDGLIKLRHALGGTL